MRLSPRINSSTRSRFVFMNDIFGRPYLNFSANSVSCLQISPLNVVHYFNPLQLSKQIKISLVLNLIFKEIQWQLFLLASVQCFSSIQLQRVQQVALTERAQAEDNIICNFHPFSICLFLTLKIRICFNWKQAVFVFSRNAYCFVFHLMGIFTTIILILNYRQYYQCFFTNLYAW